MNPKIFTVKEVNEYIASIIEGDENLGFIGVEGEVTNWNIWNGNVAFFSLRDEDSLLNCVMFGVPRELVQEVRDGMSVLAIGKIRIYHKRGVYQLYCDEIRILSRMGRLFRLYNELKERLKREGLFDKPRKPLPPFPKRIAVVTSRDGAALQDIVRTLSKRYPLVELRLYHTQVQGETAKYEIVRALQMADRDDVDLVLLARGGGSLEDLWAFNEEMVVRAVYELHHPVITGVGHEVDFTLVDFVADRRAPTPTGAAEAATPDIEDIKKALRLLKTRMVNAISKRLEKEERGVSSVGRILFAHHPARQLRSTIEKLDNLLMRTKTSVQRTLEKREWILKSHLMTLSAFDPSRRTERERENLENIFAKLKKSVESSMEERTRKLQILKEKLDLASPETLLKRGYSMVKKDGNLVKSISQMKKGDVVTLEFWDGNAEAVIGSVTRRTGTEL